MPVTLSADKKLRADARKEAANRKVRAEMKVILKKFRTTPTNQTLKEVFSVLDVAAKKGVIPKKRADRKKSRLTSFLSQKKVAKAERPKQKITKKQKLPSQKG